MEPMLDAFEARWPHLVRRPADGLVSNLTGGVPVRTSSADRPTGAGTSGRRCGSRRAWRRCARRGARSSSRSALTRPCSGWGGGAFPRATAVAAVASQGPGRLGADAGESGRALRAGRRRGLGGLRPGLPPAASRCPPTPSSGSGTGRKAGTGGRGASSQPAHQRRRPSTRCSGGGCARHSRRTVRVRVEPYAAVVPERPRLLRPPVFPGAGYVEMALAALSATPAARRCSRICDRGTAAAAGGGTRAVQFVLPRGPVRGIQQPRRGGSERWRRHAADGAAGSRLDGVPRERSRRSARAALERRPCGVLPDVPARGVEYGPAFQGITALEWRRRAVAHARLPEAMLAEAALPVPPGAARRRLPGAGCRIGWARDAPRRLHADAGRTATRGGYGPVGGVDPRRACRRGGSGTLSAVVRSTARTARSGPP